MSTSQTHAISDIDVRTRIGTLFQSRNFALVTSNLGKSGDQLATLEDWKKVAMSLPRLYAVVEAAEVSLLLGLDDSLVQAFRKMASPETSPTSMMAWKMARLAWQAQQPLLGEERLDRPIMGCTSGSLPPGELEKDATRIQATAALVLEYLMKT